MDIAAFTQRRMMELLTHSLGTKGQKVSFSVNVNKYIFVVQPQAHSAHSGEVTSNIWDIKAGLQKTKLPNRTKEGTPSFCKPHYKRNVKPHSSAFPNFA